jgi:glycosylphosphatidylinositol transamidase (GPIT) subunit GPI8
MQLLTGRYSADTPTPLKQQLRSGPNSNVLIYMTGHGGDGFLKFHDQQELSSAGLAHVFMQMWLLGRYGQIFLIVDTCQAASLGDYLHNPHNPHSGGHSGSSGSSGRSGPLLEFPPHVTYLSSSEVGENSYVSLSLPPPLCLALSHST